MGVAGFFINGAVTLVTSVVAADLGRREALRKNADTLSTVSGIVDGTGNTAAAIGQVVIPLLEEWLGWNSVFYLFLIMVSRRRCLSWKIQ